MATRKLDFSLRLRHDKDDLSVVTRQLGIASEVGWNRGDPKVSLKGLPLEGQRDFSYRTFPLGVVTDVDVDVDVDVEAAIPECLERLMPFSSVLQSFVNSDGTASSQLDGSAMPMSVGAESPQTLLPIWRNCA
jgi:hypothetical protein